MLNLTPPDYKYCPFCGQPLKIRMEEDQERKFCPIDNWIYYPRITQSAAAVIEKDNQVLLVKRAREPYKGTWMFPAGYVNYGENPRDALNREVKEETGLTVISAKLFQVIQSVDDKREPGHLLFFYLVKVSDNQITVQNDPDENSEIAWFKFQDSPEIGWVSHHELMEKIKQEGLEKVVNSLKEAL